MKKKSFVFNGIKLDISKVRGFAKVKEYTPRGIKPRTLLQGKTGELYLYEKKEEVNYMSNDNYIYEIYASVKNEADAERLSLDRDIRRYPFFIIINDAYVTGSLDE